MIAGPGAEGTLMIGTTDMRASPHAADVVARFRAQGYEPLGTTLHAYAAVQVWAQAVETAKSLNLDAVTAVLHGRQFDTVLGKIGVDAKGDVTGSSRGAGTSGRRTAPTSRWTKAWPRNSEGKPAPARQIFRIAAGRIAAQNIFHRPEA
jgi:ABC-type branched-subunit amino acid transport system substrate-binding protein